MGAWRRPWCSAAELQLNQVLNIHSTPVLVFPGEKMLASNVLVDAAIRVAKSERSQGWPHSSGSLISPNLTIHFVPIPILGNRALQDASSLPAICSRADFCKVVVALLTGSRSQTEFDLAPSKQRPGRFLSGARTAFRVLRKFAKWRPTQNSRPQLSSRNLPIGYRRTCDF
jgi:hypothetical protein